MSLVSNVQSRYSAQLLRNLTNPDAPAPTTLDATRLALAATDVQADFLGVGLTYDDTDAQHVAVACEGVIAYLTERVGSEMGKSPLAEFRDRLDKLRMVTSNDRILPGTNTATQATIPGETTTLRPPFDDSRLRGIVLEPPNTGTGEIDDEGN